MTGKKALFVSLGCLNIALGALGILLPLLPTTPFLLLAAFLFSKSSDRLHHWLLRHRILGPYIHAFGSKTGLTRAQKVRICCSFTVLMAVSVYFAPMQSVRAALAGLWVVWTVVVWRMKTAPTPVPDMEVDADALDGR